MELNVNVRTVSDLLSVNKKYVVPRFQREYSWGSDELSAFWSDVVHAIKRTKGSLQPTEHFLGAIVVIGEDKSFSLQIVDGQQRLTTVTILIRELVTALMPVAPEAASALYANNIEGKNDDGKEYFKLANETPKPFFQNNIQFLHRGNDEPSTDEEKALSEASRYFQSQLSAPSLVDTFGAPPEKSMATADWGKMILLAIRDQVLRHLKVVFLSVVNEDDAYTIFETLNARGLSLSVVDLIKNEVFKNLRGEHPDDEAKTKWKTLQASLGQRDKDVKIETFFRHFWLSNYSFVREGRIFAEFKGLQRSGGLQISDFYRRLVESGDIYMQIANPQLTDWPRLEEREVFRAFEAINLFGVTQVRSLLLAMTELYKAEKLKLAAFKKFAQILEDFHFVYTAVCSSRPSGLDGMYSKIARRIRVEHDPLDGLNDLATSLQAKRPSLQKFDDAYRHLRFSKSETKSKKLIQYMFKRHERFLHGTKELELDAISIEHIMDQSSGGSQIGMMGNLLPLDSTLNNEMGPAKFVQKLPVYGKSGLETVQIFLKEHGTGSTWGDQQILERTIALARIAYEEIWTM